jgi:hypothetical protein
MPVIEIDSLDDQRFTELFTSFTDSAWRLETLDAYSVAYEEEAYKAFLEGDLSLIHERPSSWIDEVIIPAVETGRDIGRVHVIERLTDEDGKLALGDYLRFEFEWYKRNRAAGEDIRIAWVKPRKWIKNVRKRGRDFWLFDEDTDHAQVMEMHYEPDGSFTKAVVTRNSGQVKAARKCKRAAMRAAKRFYP